MSEPVLESIRSVVDLFDAELSGVHFPEVDRDILALAVEQVMLGAEAVAQAEAQLLAARSSLCEQQDALLGKAQRALAYARIYAEDDAGLTARLDGIVLPRRGKAAGRADAGDASLSASDATGTRRRARVPREIPPATLFTPGQDQASA